MTQLPGLDLDRLSGYLDGVLRPFPTGPIDGAVIEGGLSNLTYVVSDGEHKLVVRRPPLGHVLPTAHDMAREYRIQAALYGSAVPVPRVRDLCEDPSVIGAPFYVMDFVDGQIYRSADDLRWVGPVRTAAIGRRFVETLVAIHAVVASDVGLSDFGRPEGFLARQVRRWKKQLDASYSRPLVGADELYDKLAQSVPTTGAPAAIVHGDYRLDNVLIDDADQVAAVVDWEMATLGDPLTDVGLILAYEQLASLDGAFADACAAPGFLTGSDLLEAYSTASGRTLEHMGFYAGLASYKLATVLEGIHFRHLRGQTTGSGFSGVGSAVEGLIAFGIQSLTTR
jgi:aminoglycoside phosphotransferase (APT) family kinase protein